MRKIERGGKVLAVMNEIKKALARLQNLGWTSAAIADELDVSPVTIFRWQKGDRQPENNRAVLHLLETMASRRRIPKRRRRGESTTYRNLSSIPRENLD